MIAEEAKDDDLKRLSPCPFCGGGITEFHDNGRVWADMRYSDPISVSVRHWCEEAPGPSRLIERLGRDKEQAIERWNMRSNGPHEGRQAASLPGVPLDAVVMPRGTGEKT